MAANHVNRHLPATAKEFVVATRQAHLPARLLITLLLASFAVFSTSAALSREVMIHVVDAGAGQPWSEDLPLVGAPSTGAGGHLDVYGPLDRPMARIAVRMPDTKDLESLNHKQLAARIASELGQQVEAGLANGIDEFELQLVQNIQVGLTPDSYFDPAAQARVTKFGKAAYAALGEVIRGLESQQHAVTVDAMLGSNGGVAFTRALDSWTPYAGNIARVTCVDCRALLDDVRPALTALEGAGSVMRILNTHMDVPASPVRLLGLQPSIANLDVSRGLLSEFSNLQLIELHPTSQKLGLSHIRSMSRPTSQYRATLHLSEHERIDLGYISGRHVTQAFSARDYRNFGGHAPAIGRTHQDLVGRLTRSIEARDTAWRHIVKQNRGQIIRVSTDALRNLSNAAKTLADAFEWFDDFETLTFGIPDMPRSGDYLILSDLYDVIRALDKDIQRAEGGSYTQLSSHSFEQIGRLGLKIVASGQVLTPERLASGAVRHGFAAGVGAVAAAGPDLVEGLSQMIVSGQLLHVEGLSKVLSGTAKGTAYAAAAITTLALGGAPAAALSMGAVTSQVVDWTIALNRKIGQTERAQAEAIKSGARDAMLEQYHLAQHNARTLGIAPKPIEIFLGMDRQTVNVLSAGDRAEANRRYGLTSPALPTRSSPTYTTITHTTSSERIIIRQGVEIRIALQPTTQTIERYRDNTLLSSTTQTLKAATPDRGGVEAGANLVFERVDHSALLKALETCEQSGTVGCDVGD